MRKILPLQQSATQAFKRPALAWSSLHLSPLSAILLSGLSAMCFSAAVFTFHALFGPADAEDAVAAPEWKPPSLAIAPLDPPKSPDGDNESLSRPIFSKSRKPSLRNTAALSANIMAAAGALSVRAIIRSKQTAKAFFLSPESPDGVWLKIGDKVDAWTITAIESKEVILQSGEETTKLSLYTDISPTATASAAARRETPHPEPQDLPSDGSTAATPKR